MNPWHRFNLFLVLAVMLLTPRFFEVKSRLLVQLGFAVFLVLSLFLVRGIRLEVKKASSREKAAL